MREPDASLHRFDKNGAVIVLDKTLARRGGDEADASQMHFNQLCCDPSIAKCHLRQNIERRYEF